MLLFHLVVEKEARSFGSLKSYSGLKNTKHADGEFGYGEEDRLDRITRGMLIHCYSRLTSSGHT